MKCGYSPMRIVGCSVCLGEGEVEVAASHCRVESIFLELTSFDVHVYQSQVGHNVILNGIKGGVAFKHDEVDVEIFAAVCIDDVAAAAGGAQERKQKEGSSW